MKYLISWPLSYLFYYLGDWCYVISEYLDSQFFRIWYGRFLGWSSRLQDWGGGGPWQIEELTDEEAEEFLSQHPGMFDDDDLEE